MEYRISIYMREISHQYKSEVSDLVDDIPLLVILANIQCIITQYKRSFYNVQRLGSIIKPT